MKPDRAVFLAAALWMTQGALWLWYAAQTKAAMLSFAIAAVCALALRFASD